MGHTPYDDALSLIQEAQKEILEFLQIAVSLKIMLSKVEGE